MANRDILKEAIADAKSIKEAAIANAKAALEEAFTPYLKEKFTAKLAEMEAEDMKEAKEEMDENYGKEEMEERLGTINDPDSDAPHGNLEEEDMEEGMSDPVMRHGMKGDDKEEKRTEKMREEESMDEMDLDELLAELDEEMGKDKDMEENLNEDARTDAEEEGYEDGMEDEKEDEEEDEIDLEDMTEDELKDLIEDVIEDMVRAGELEAGENFEGEEDEEEEDIDIDMEDEEEETVAERAYYGKNKGDKPRKSTAKEDGELLKEEEDVNEIVDPISVMIATVAGILSVAGGGAALMSKLEKRAQTDAKAKKVYDFITGFGKSASGGIKEEDMDEMKKEIEELASTLSETKLLNAKLLYTNKIFRAKNLTETQKVKVLEAFDKAASVKDAKLIYETLTSVKETKVVNESVRGMASKAAGIAPEKKPILEVNDQFARWQILAGIKK
jgi:hypothetical protein